MSWLGINLFVIAAVAIVYGYAHEDKVIAFEQRLFKRPALKGMYKTVRETEEYVIVKERRK